MATSNEEIRDGLTRHQIRVLRFARSLESELLELITRPNARLRDMIEALLRAFPAGGFRVASAEKKIRDFERRLVRLYGPIERQALNLLRDRLLEFAVREVDFTRTLITTALPVAYEFEKPKKRDLRNMVRTFPHEGLALTGWNSKLWAGDRDRILGEIRAGLLFNESQTQIVRRVFGRRSLQGRDGIRDVTRRAGAMLARTVVNSVANQARTAFYQENAVLEKELYVATLDSRTTAVCRANDGGIHNVGEGPVPPLHRNCRSLRVPYIEDAERLGTRPANAAVRKELEGLRGPERRRAVETMVGRVPETQTYATFLRNQSVAFQNEALGVTKAKLFRNGGLELDRFVDPTGRELTLQELYDLERDAFVRAGVPAP